MHMRVIIEAPGMGVQYRDGASGALQLLIVAGEGAQGNSYVKKLRRSFLPMQLFTPGYGWRYALKNREETSMRL